MEAVFEREVALRRVRAGVLGWICGATLGAPHEGKKDWLNLSFYTPIPDGMAPTFGTDVAAAYLKEDCVTEFGLSDVWLRRIQRGPDAFRFAQANLRRGLRAPLSGSFENPFSGDGGAVGRAPLWGLTFAGRPAEAAKWAWRDATIDHAADAVWLSAFWAAAIAAAPFETSVAACLSVGEQMLPPDTELRVVAAAVLQAWRVGKTWQEAREAVLAGGKRLPEDASATHGFALAGCLYGGGDFGRSACIAAGCGGMAAETAGAVAALLLAGIGDAPDDWLAPVGDVFVSQAGSSTIEWFAQAVVERFLRNSAAGAFRLVDIVPAPAADGETGAEATAAAEPDREFLRDRSAIEPTFGRSQQEALQEVGEVVAGFFYPDGVVPPTEGPIAIAFSVENPGPIAVEIEPAIEATEGLSVAHRAQRLRLDPGAKVRIAAVAKVEGTPKGEACVSMRLAGREIRAPILSPQIWWTAGPFDNREKEGYEKEFAPERSVDPNAVFSGRSAQGFRWERRRFAGCILDLEPLFVKAPGVVYLTTEAFFEQGGPMTLVAASGVGQVVWVNGERRARYQDTHRPIPKPVAPYAVPFETFGWTRFLVKVTRDDAPLPPTVLYFLDADGRVVYPTVFRQPGTESEV